MTDIYKKNIIFFNNMNTKNTQKYLIQKKQNTKTYILSYVNKRIKS